jgi:hypothetical protein
MRLESESGSPLVAGTLDGKTFRLYVNGVLEGLFEEVKTIGDTQYPWAIVESFILGIDALPFFR